MALDTDAKNLLLQGKWAATATVTTPAAAGITPAAGWDARYSQDRNPERGVFNNQWRGFTAMFLALSRGFLEWDAGLNYTHPACVYGSDDTVYISLSDSGPDNGGAENPTSMTQTSWVPLLRQASTTIAGVVQRASDAEVTAGTDTSKYVTPKHLADRSASDATTTARGIVELATEAEVRTGTDTERAVTPAGFRSAGDARWQQIGAAQAVGFVGEIKEFAGTVLPSGGWLWCRGQAVSRTTYSDLFATINTAYGSGDGSTTFNVPDKQGIVGVGKRVADDIGDTGGAREVTLTSAQMPRHSHGGGSHSHTMSHTHSIGSHSHTIPSHTHGRGSLRSYDRYVTSAGRYRLGHHCGGHNFWLLMQSNQASANVYLRDGQTGSGGAGTTRSGGGTSGAASSSTTGSASVGGATVGGSQAHENMPPYLVTNFIIKY